MDIYYPNAKINLGLSIGDTLPDGYHEIVTAMAPVSYEDILELHPALPGGPSRLHTSGHHVECPEEKNLVMKALRLMQSEAAAGEFEVYLHKDIPDGAGLGGGSADAAFMLKAVNATLDNPLGEEELRRLAARLGSDCPLFIANRPCMATGTGSTLSPLALPQLRGCMTLIVKGEGSVSTAEAYRSVKPSHISEERMRAILATPLEQWQGILRNDFEETVFAFIPLCAELKDRLLRCGAAYASLTGSGSAVFGIFREEQVADEEGRQSIEDLFADLPWHRWCTFIGTESAESAEGAKVTES